MSDDEQADCDDDLGALTATDPNQFVRIFDKYFGLVYRRRYEVFGNRPGLAARRWLKSAAEICNFTRFAGSA